MQIYASPVKREPRRLFVAGRLVPRRDPRPCTQTSHAGPLVDTARFDAAGSIWTGQGVCARCGSHVHRDNIRRAS